MKTREYWMNKLAQHDHTTLCLERLYDAGRGLASNQEELKQLEEKKVEYQARRRIKRDNILTELAHLSLSS